MGWKDGLNESQLEAASQLNGQVLILAGAGSGKTKTLTQRICHMIEEGIPGNEILAITFTNKAAKEMKERIIQLIGDIENKPKMCTFHSLGFDIVKAYGSRLGYRPHMGICDDEDQKKRLKDALEKVEKTNHYENDKLTKDNACLSSLAKYISEMKDLCLFPDEISPDGPPIDGFKRDDFLMAYSFYQEDLKKDNQVDFDDLIMIAVRLLEIESIASHYWNVYKYISVDEYQDTSKAQFKMVYLLAKGNKNICVVGDDYQSIYGFRGADINNILSFESVYPDANRIVLGENYRSTPQIVNGASAVIANNEYQMHKDLFSMNDDGAKITVASFEDYTDEARYIAKKITMGLEKGRNGGDYAILYRKNATSRCIEDALLSQNIHYVIYGGVSFYARKEIKDLIAYLKLASGSENSIAFKRIANIPKRGIGKKSLSDIVEGIGERDGSLLTRLNSYVEESKNEKSKVLYEVLAKYKTYAEYYEPSNLIKRIIDDLNFEDYLRKEYASENENGEDRIENIHDLVSKAKEFETDYHNEHPDCHSPLEVLEAFLEDISLLTDTDRNKDDKTAVKLMTMHTSKGLEFDTVFLVACEEGNFKYSDINYQKAIEEERRLFYVGMTRAKRKLYVSHSYMRLLYGRRSPMTKLRFIDEIPSNLCKFVSDTDRFSNVQRLPQSTLWYKSL